MLLLAVATSAMGDVPYLNPHVWAEGADKNQARALLKEYSQKIQQCQN